MKILFVCVYRHGRCVRWDVSAKRRRVESGDSYNWRVVSTAGVVAASVWSLHTSARQRHVQRKEQVRPVKSVSQERAVGTEDFAHYTDAEKVARLQRGVGPTGTTNQLRLLYSKVCMRSLLTPCKLANFLAMYMIYHYCFSQQNIVYNREGMRFRCWDVRTYGMGVLHNLQRRREFKKSKPEKKIAFSDRRWKFQTDEIISAQNLIFSLTLCPRAIKLLPLLPWRRRPWY